MTYNYQDEKANLFTEDGLRILLAVRDRAKSLIKESGACTFEKAMSGATGSSWTMLAAIEYLCKTGELQSVELPNCRTQHQILIGPSSRK